MAKLLKEGKEIGGFAVKGKGKEEIWKREKKCELKRERERTRGSTTMVSNTHL